MGNTPKKQRPSTARKHTRRTEEKRTNILEQGLRIKFNGVDYEVRLGDLSALDTLALRRETGFTMGRLMGLDPEDFDIDVIAVVIWLTRRIAGERTLRYATVAAEIDYSGVEDAATVDEDDDAAGESQPADA